MQTTFYFFTAFCFVYRIINGKIYISYLLLKIYFVMLNVVDLYGEKFISIVQENIITEL